jgi:hypothetical protein
MLIEFAEAAFGALPWRPTIATERCMFFLEVNIWNFVQ